MNYKLLFRDASLTLFTQIVTALSGMLIMLIISREFGLGSYGEYYIVKRVSDILWLFFLLGMTVSLPRNKAFIDKTKGKGSAEFSFVILPVLSTLLFLLLSDILMTLLLEDLKSTLGLIVSMLVIGMIFYATFVSYLRATSRFIVLNLNTFINFSIIPLIPFLFTNDTISYLKIYSLILLVFNLILYIVFSSILIAKYHPFKEIKWKVIGFLDFLKYGTLRLPGLFLASLIFTLPVTILNYLGSNEDIGALGQVFQLFSIISMPINALGIILLPNFSQVISEGNVSSLKAFLKKGIKFIFIVSTMIAMIIAIFIEEILYLINGEYIAFENLISIKILILTVIPYSIYNFLRNPIDAAHKTPFSTILVLFSFIISALICFVVYGLTELMNFELVIMFTSLNLFLLGIGSLFYTSKLYFKKV